MMTVKIGKLILCGLLLSNLPKIISQESAGQPNDSRSKVIEYKSGQIWTTAFGPTITILKVEDLPKLGKVVHIRVDDIPNGGCGSDHLLTSSIEHLAVTEKMVRKSVIDLANEKADLPDSYLDAYREWANQKKHEVLKKPLRYAILSITSTGPPMICNFLPVSPNSGVSTHHPDEVLFKRAMSALQNNRFDVANLTFQTLINTYPDSEYTSKAEHELEDSRIARCGQSFSSNAECNGRLATAPPAN
jgi:hypothetical protein